MKNVYLCLIFYIIRVLCGESGDTGVKSAISNLIGVPPNISLSIEPDAPSEIDVATIRKLLSTAKTEIARQMDELIVELNRVTQETYVDELDPNILRRNELGR